MCIPKHYIKPQPLPRQILSQAIDLDMGLASKPGSTDYKGALTYLLCSLSAAGRSTQRS